MANDKRICKACGNEYQYCPTCAKYANLPKWMWKCDTDECNDIFDSISGYKMGTKNIDEVISVIKKYNIKDYSKFTDSIQKTLNEIYPYPLRKNNKKKMDIEFIKTEPITEEVIAAIEPVIDNELMGISIE